MHVAVPSKKHWSQFRLRSLLISITAVCVLLAFVLSRAREQQKAVHAIEKVYGRVYYDYQITNNGNIDSSAVSWLPQWLSRSLAKHVFHSVVFVDLDCEPVTDATLAEVIKLRHVEILHISNASITNDGLRDLKVLPQLRVVTLYTAGISDGAVAYLAGCPLLREVAIENAEISDSGIMHFKRARRLKRLSLVGTKITETGLLHLQLELPHCQIEN